MTVQPALARPDIDPQPKGAVEQVLLAVFVVVPFLALLAAVPLAWGWGLGWHDIVIGVVFYFVSGFGVTVGFHRLFTHGSFKAKPALRVGLAVAGSLALEMGVIDWVATHRRHHKYADREGDPHSPWRFGSDWKALTKGLAYAHVGWMFDTEVTSAAKFCPDLLADRRVRWVHDRFTWFVVASLLLPAVIGGLWSMSWQGALTAFFWGSLVRIALLHHVTWSINSICHTFGEETFEVRDKSRNVWWLAIPSMGESWHNLHHSDPTCARHGALPGQIDPSAAVIRAFERLGWVTDVRWPNQERLAARRIDHTTHRAA
ncbi:acyl-CoA desaturase [Kutzneria viridogrisea]|nr:acyl-CoA desaturase [Kutzneria albida]MBA8930245.1 stearoyl-CoA desaturase (delta-9 desaturase) [Kutzneria viridogrisea]